MKTIEGLHHTAIPQKLASGKINKWRKLFLKRVTVRHSILVKATLTKNLEQHQLEQEDSPATNYSSNFDYFDFESLEE